MARLGSITSATDITAGGGGAPQALFETRTLAAAATIDAAVKTLRTAGYALPGDGGEGLYQRRAMHPYKLWQSGQNYAASTERVFYRNSNGTFYVLIRQSGYNNSSVQPTHTTIGQYAEGADGYGWVAVNQNPAFFRSVDRFTSAGATDATNGGWWELVPEGGDLHIEQLGGSAGYVNSGSLGTDNYGPLTHARYFTAWMGDHRGRQTYRIRFRLGKYWISDTVYFYEQVNIEGHSSFQGDQTQLYFPNNKDGFVFHGFNTGPAGGGLGKTGVNGYYGQATYSKLKGLNLFFDNGGWITDHSKCAIFARTTIHLENIGIFSAPGKGVYYLAYTDGTGGNDYVGNANQWNVINLYVHSCKGDAFHVLGSDVNGGAMFGLRTHTQVGGCGIRNESYYTNAYHGLQITGYGNQGVYHSGGKYVLIYPPAGRLVSAGGTVPGTNNAHWYRLYDAASADGMFPQWVDDGSHIVKQPIYDPGSGSVYYNPYIEIGGAATSEVRAPAMIVGGEVPSTIYTNYHKATINAGFSSTMGVGGYVNFRANPSDAGYVRHGQSMFASVGTKNTGAGALWENAGLNVLRFGRDKPGEESFEWAWDGFNNITLYPFNARPIWGITTPSSTKTYGKPIPQPYEFVLHDPILVDPGGISGTQQDGRVLSFRDALPTRRGIYTQGSTYLNQNASPGGVVGWICTTAGTIADQAWAAGNISALTIVSTTAGRFYQKEVTWGATSIEPTHTSPIRQTLADGAVWTYIGNTAPVFKTWGTIAA